MPRPQQPRQDPIPVVQAAAAIGPQMLTDTFNRNHTYLRISVTEKCNLRCQYCMPDEGIKLTPKEEILTTPEIIRVAKLFCAAGVNKIRLTGGEPSVRPDIITIVQELGKIPGLDIIGMTSNGVGLPRKLPALVAAGLNRLNLSLDTLQEHKFTFISRRKGFSHVIKSIDLAIELGIKPLKINCVVMRCTNLEEITDFVELVKHKPIDIRFIEYMPFGGNNYNKDTFVSFVEMMEVIEKDHPKLVRVDTGPNDTARSYRCEGYKGTVSFITSMSKAFCSSCNRLRMTADGNLKVCLFGNTEQNLRDRMREGMSDLQIAEVVQAAVMRKKAAHAGQDNLMEMENRPMILIGG